MWRSLGVVLFVGAASIAALAQSLYIGEPHQNPRWGSKSDFDGSVLFCYGYYESTRTEFNGSGWWTDYPGAGHNFLARLSELTTVRVRLDETGRIPFYAVMKLSDPQLVQCPVLFMSDVGTIGLQPGEVSNLQHYFAKGGFLWVDDFWGTDAWNQWEREIRRVLPALDYRLIDIPPDHLIRHTLYDVPEVPQIPSIGIWNARASGEWMDATGEVQTSTNPSDRTSERYEDSRTVNFRAIVDERDRIIVVMTHNTDIADAFEEEKPENQPFVNEFAARGYAVGINIFLYALTH